MKIYIVLAACLLSFLCLGVGSADTTKKTFPMLQGTTNETSTVVTALVPAAELTGLRLVDSKGAVIRPDRELHTLSPNKEDKLIRASFSGLTLTETYRAEIFVKDGEVRDSRVLRTYDTKKAAPRIALLSCLNQANSDKFRGLWLQMREAKPDLLFLIGDNVYVDPEGSREIPDTEGDFWDIYKIAWSNTELYHLPELTPSYATWDDHDFGMNDGDSTFAMKHVAAKVFKAFYGTEPVTEFTDLGPGVSSVISMNGQDFYFLDNRSFMELKRASPSESVYWGKDQEEWLYKSIEKNKRPSWLINGSQVFGAYMPKESFEKNHPHRLKETLARLKALKTPVLFVSGDRHFSEIMKIESAALGYTTFEITSSPVQSSPFPSNPWVFFPNKKRHVNGIAKKNNFILAETWLENGWPQVLATGIAFEEGVVLREQLSMKEGL